ncbi:RNA polymerase sigma-70 factor, ECF subfamily [Ekhidna lutea]|uniref:RNA polymerase sigma-70 factor, ECF subfamily n=1 Tax=Ekhidna lutea TaxID=447679 RepID=A0A239L5M8_EKHLU|nr:sigma-70 family RNA polymerase sigma factor [Ekhidna lutea]SNT24844.1 RNA polymerase sigma-70 factor, ECF subfamily [Ekhidna lutea]
MKESEQRKIFNEWLDEHRALLFKVIRSYAFTTEDQNDLFQDVCMQVYRSVPNFKAASAVSTWLYRIALNTAIKWSTKERKHTDGHQEVEKMGNLLMAQNESSDERIGWLYDEIKKFNEIDRSLTLLLLDGFSYKEMSDMMGITESNIGVKIHRIKKQLTENSKQYEYGV